MTSESKDDTIFKQFSPMTKQVFAYILKYHPVSRMSIGQDLERTPMSIKRAIETLEEAKLVREDGIGESTGGRKPILYTVDDSHHYLGAVNISMTYCEVTIMNLHMKTLAVYDFALNADSRPGMVMDMIAMHFQRLLSELYLKKEQILGVGVSVFSSLDRNTGNLIRPIILYLNEEWTNYPISNELHKRLGLPIEVEKGTNAAAMLEYRYGKARESERMLYVLCAMNIRSAVVVKGELQGVTPYYEDAFGHMTINYDGERCQCGRYGCVDCYTTIPVIMDQFYLGIKKGRNSILKDQADRTGVSFQDVCHASEEGDPLACEVITAAANMLGLALANYVDLFSPDMVLLSGLLVQESPLYFKVAMETAKQKAGYSMGQQNVKFERGSSFKHSITTGAGAILLERLTAR